MPLAPCFCAASDVYVGPTTISLAPFEEFSFRESLGEGIVCAFDPTSCGVRPCRLGFSLRDMFILRSISIVVWDSICALRALFGVASDVHFVPTIHDFYSPRVASFRDGLGCSYMGSGRLYAYVARVRFGVGYALPKFSLRDMFKIFVVVWDSICALRALFGVASDVHFVPTTYECDGPLAASFRDRLACL